MSVGLSRLTRIGHAARRANERGARRRRRGHSFLDVEARHDFGGGWSTGLAARRGWTSFAGGSFETGAYGIDLTKTGLLGDGDQFGLRIAQPLRVEHGGFAMLLPTAYDYATETATDRSAASR